MLTEYAKDAAKKLTALPERLAAEAVIAAEEGRKPFPIVPLTEVHPQLLAPALAGLRDVPSEVAEIVGMLRKVCAKQPNTPFAMQSDQLLAVLKLVGVADAEV